MRMLSGKRKDLNALLKQYGFALLIQTSFIERVNLTIRRGIAPLMRKTWSLCARKGIHFSGAKAPTPMEVGSVQRLTQKPKGQWGHKRDVKKGERRFHQTNVFLRTSSTW